MEVAANIHEDDTITPDGGKLIVGQGYASNNISVPMASCPPKIYTSITDQVKNDRQSSRYCRTWPIYH